MSKPVLLIVDDSEEFLRSLRRALAQDYEVRCARSRAEALSLLIPPPDAALLDLRLDESDVTNREGLNLLQELHTHFPYMPILMVTAYGDINIAVEAMKSGAVDFLQKPVDLQELRTRLAHALQETLLKRRAVLIEEQLRRIEPGQIIGDSPPMQEVKRLIEAAAQDGRVTVLVTGETGTGKELVARAIHAQGVRRQYPFVAVALAALPLQMVEAELFGYEAGAFTDARERHIGYIEAAHGGVLFLDEISETDQGVQAKLLRFLEERTFQRLGSIQPIHVDTQVIAATNADLLQRVHEGRFREDLYYRLKVYEVHLPSLRERKEDIPALANYFLRLQRMQGRRVERISSDAMELLIRYDWPGNVRQLKNFLEAAALRAQLEERNLIEARDLPRELLEVSSLHSPQSKFSVHESVARAELQCVEEALQKVGGKKTEAWKLLGYTNRFTFTRRVRLLLERFPHLRQEFPTVASRF